MHNGTTRVINTLTAALVLAGTSALAQAPLDPPGPPAPTMHSLDEIFTRTEDAANLAGAAAHHAGIAGSRTPISEAPFVINESGSYVVTENLIVTNLFAHGIEVNAYHVTLDLNGYMLKGPGANSGSGIYQPAQYENLTVRNGTVLGWNELAEGGISARGKCNRIENVSVLHNDSGIIIGPNSRVAGCIAFTNQAFGIYGDSACTVSKCTVNGSSDGISVKSGLIADCVSAHNNWGISADSNATIRGCESLGGFEGITAGANCLVTDNVAGDLTDRSEGSGSACIRVTGNNNRIVNNHCTGADNGLEIDGENNYVAGNTVRDNNDNYEIVQGNQLNLLLCEVPETIDWPCSVKFAGTLTCAQTNVHGITVNASDVTIDMAGHALVGPGTNDNLTSGIHQASGAGLRNLVVTSGKVVNWLSFPPLFTRSAGISANGTGSRIVGVEAASNDVGIVTGPCASVRDCTANHNPTTGISVGEGATIQDCAAYNNGDGIIGRDGAAILNCAAYKNSEHGFNLVGCITIHGCAAYENKIGIWAWMYCLIDGNACYKNTSGNIVAGSGSVLGKNVGAP